MPIQLESYTSGHLEKGVGYKYFVPTKINDQWEWIDPELNSLLERASIKLGELNSYARLVPNIDLFIHLHVTKEAVISSRIEGTQTNINEALFPEEEIIPERRNDWKEVNNYTKALNTAITDLKDLPLSSRLLRNTHKILMDGVRGEHKLPGAFRNSQNWIGGYSLSDAIFIPPTHHYVPDLMSDLEKFLHNQDIKIPALIKIGIIHYQFETIHPFLDGNGRIGRLLITLFMVSEKILDKPLLYLSLFFERNKNLYYDKLMRVREKNEMLKWLKYFLIGVAETAEEAVNTLSKVFDLKKNLEEQIHLSWGRRIKTALQLLNYLFEQPVIHVKQIEAVCDLSFKTANDLVSSFEKAGILKETTGQSRNRIFVFESYVNLFK
jgi:Fic family protein